MPESMRKGLLVRVLVQVIDTVGIERRRPSFDAVNLVAFVEQELGQIRAVLASNTGYQCFHKFSSMKRPGTLIPFTISGLRNCTRTEGKAEQSLRGHEVAEAISSHGRTFVIRI